MSNGVLWKSPMFDFSGYAALARDLLLTLHREGVPLQADPTVRDQKFLQQMATGPAENLEIWGQLLNTAIDAGVHVIFHPPTSWDGINHYETWKKEKPGFNSYVGITMFETDLLPYGWADACNMMDEIWVPSRFNLDTFARAGVPPEKLQVMPFGLNAALYDPGNKYPLRIPGKRGFTFLSVFQWNRRKGWDVLLQAYLKAFSSQDDVCLVIRAYPDAIKQPAIRDRVRNYVYELGYDADKIPPIIVIDEFIPDERMPNLYLSADCFVLPTRGEGWGIPFMEAMASGLPTIGTNWSSHLDFMNDQNSYLIELDGMEHIPLEHMLENPFYTPDQQWAAPSVEHTAQIMRRVFENRDEAKAVGAVARRDIVSSWSLEKSAAWVKTRTKELLSKPPRPAREHKRPVKIKAECTPAHGIQASSQPMVSSRLTIGVDARILTNQDAMWRGIGHYTYHHLLALVQLTPAWNYRLYIENKPLGSELFKLALYPNVTISNVAEISSHQLDIFHIPDPMTTYQGIGSPMLLIPHGVPSTVLFHDLIPLIFANEFLHTWPHNEQQVYQSRLEQIISSQSVILCNSCSTRDDLARYLSLSPERLKVIMAGLNKHPDHTATEEETKTTCEKYNITLPFYLSVGILDPQKNFFSTLSAFLELRRTASVQLVVVGAEEKYKAQIREFLRENNVTDVIFTGFVSRQELESLYSAAIALLFPSLYEGFGFPVIESMAHGCPVIASDTSSIPEVAGEAAILCDPRDVPAMATAMNRLLTEPALRDELRHKGYQQAARFTWENTAHTTISVWGSMLKETETLRLQP
jgi:glycosyltransferase involved in cell wall biosynthesis